MKLRLSLGVFVLALPAYTACGDRAMRSCTDLVEAKRWEEAAARCGQVFEETRDPRAGAAAAKADYALGRYGQAMAWVARLKSGSIPPGLLNVEASIYLRRGEADLAEKTYLRDVEISRAAGDHRRAAASLYSLYYLTWPASRYREAFDFAAGAFEEAAKAEDRELQSRCAEALYTILYSLGDLEGARRALETATELLPPEKVLDRARVLVNQGILMGYEGKLALARHAIEEALELADGQGGDALFYRSAHLNLAHVGLLQGELDQVSEHLQQALRYPDPDGTSAAPLLYYQARLQRERGRPEAALQNLRVVLDPPPSPDWEWDLEYERGRAEEDRGEFRKAVEAYERSAAIVEAMRRELGFDEFKAWLLDRKREPFEALFLLHVREGRTREAIEVIERAKARTFQDAFIQAASPRPASEAWSIASVDRFESLEKLLPVMNESPAASLRPVGQLLESLGNRHGLVYFEARNEVWLVTLAEGDVRPYRLAPSTEVRSLVDRFLADPDDLSIAEALGKRLLPPGSLPEPGGTLHVVADGVLGRLPFAALRPSGRALVEDHAIAYVPSLNALASVSDRTRRAWTPPVVLADPTGDLPAAAAEARQVAALLGIEPRVGPAASREEFRKASSARVLHLATHTGAGAGGAWLRLADDEERAGEILAGKVQPRLAVLATCASALPTGRGMWGSLGSAFLAAGSEAVLASLWSIEDRPAREFVLRFYREGGALEPASALARTQRGFLAEGRPPSFWAPFVMFGADQLLN